MHILSSVTDYCPESMEGETKAVTGQGIEPEPQALEPNALPTALRGPASLTPSLFSPLIQRETFA